MSVNCAAIPRDLSHRNYLDMRREPSPEQRNCAWDVSNWRLEALFSWTKSVNFPLKPRLLCCVFFRNTNLRESVDRARSGPTSA